MLYVSARGLTTGLIPHGDRGVLRSTSTSSTISWSSPPPTGSGGRCRCEPGPIADFYRELMAALDELGSVHARSGPMPVEIPDAIPFDADTQHVAYDADAAHRFWLALVQMDRVFEVFRIALRRQGQPGALLLGCARPRGHAVLRAARAHNIPAARRTAART